LEFPVIIYSAVDPFWHMPQMHVDKGLVSSRPMSYRITTLDECSTNPTLIP